MPKGDPYIDSKQFASKGKSTKDTLVSVLHNVHTAIDHGDIAVRVLFTDFTKGIDLIGHNILVSKLVQLGVSKPLVQQSTAFLTNCKQWVEIGVFPG